MALKESTTPNTKESTAPPIIIGICSVEKSAKSYNPCSNTAPPKPAALSQNEWLRNLASPIKSLARRLRQRFADLNTRRSQQFIAQFIAA